MLGGKSANNVKGFLFSHSAITVYSAIVATPIVLGAFSRFSITQIPVWMFLAILGFIAFLISSALHGVLQAVVTGVSLGIFINALFATNFGARLSARLGNLKVSG